jgi:alkyldihydroxyacetonephosphate synthase
VQVKNRLLSKYLTYELEDLVGGHNVITDPDEMDAQSLDVWWVTRYLLTSRNTPLPRPMAIVFPRSTGDIVRLVRFANEHRIPVTPRGGGAGDVGGALPIHGGIVVDTKRMDKIIELNEKSLTVRVQPGIIQKDLEVWLNRRGYTTNHLPASLTTSTIGGFISTNGTGVLSSRYGKMTDLVHQVEVVLPNGTVFRSLPVNRHSTGPDYSRLFFGAEGTFGMVTEALCKIYYLPEKRYFGTFLLPSLSAGIEAGRQIMVSGLNPSLMRLYDEVDTAHILKDQYGLDVDGSVLIMGFDGKERVVDVLSAEAMRMVEAAGGRDLGEKTARTWWENRYKSYYPPKDYIYYPWMMAVMDTVAPYEKIETIYRAMKAAIEDGFRRYDAVFHAHFSHWYDWGTSFYPSFVLKCYPDDEEEALRIYYRIVCAAVRASIRNGGVVNEHHGIGLRLGSLMREAYGEGYDLAVAVKRALDPNNIMNPGKLGLGD